MMHRRIDEIADADVALVATPAVEMVLWKRIEQIRDHGHDAAADDAVGPHRLVRHTSERLRDVSGRILREAEHQAMAATDMTYGDIGRLDSQARQILLNRLATSAAMTIAAMEAIQRIPAAADERTPS